VFDHNFARTHVFCVFVFSSGGGLSYSRIIWFPPCILFPEKSCRETHLSLLIFSMTTLLLFSPPSPPLPPTVAVRAAAAAALAGAAVAAAHRQRTVGSLPTLRPGPSTGPPSPQSTSLCRWFFSSGNNVGPSGYLQKNSFLFWSQPIWRLSMFVFLIIFAMDFRISFCSLSRPRHS